MPKAPQRFKHPAYRGEKQRKKDYDRTRESSSKRGYGSKWQKARKTYLDKNPICVRCHELGVITQADVVDHIIPHKGNQKLFWDKNNWQALCTSCHNRKTAKEDSSFSGFFKG